MGGRVYSPAIGRFLSADPFIQAPYNSQSYNRYSYVWNNPLSATDPSGFVMNFSDSDSCKTDENKCSNRAQFEKKKCERLNLICEYKKDGQGQWRAVGTTHSLVTLSTARAAGLITRYVQPLQLNNINWGDMNACLDCKKYESYFERLQFIFLGTDFFEKFKKLNPIEYKLFKAYAIMNVAILNMNLRFHAYIWNGFDDYARKNSMKYVNGTGLLDVYMPVDEILSLMVKSPAATVAVEILSTANSMRDVHGSIEFSSQALEAIKIRRFGPQRINEATFYKRMGGSGYEWFFDDIFK